MSKELSQEEIDKIMNTPLTEAEKDDIILTQGKVIDEMISARKRYRCVDCKEDKYPGLYMIKNEIWQSVCKEEDILCLNHFSIRLGRKLLITDFSNV